MIPKIEVLPKAVVDALPVACVVCAPIRSPDHPPLPSALKSKCSRCEIPVWVSSMSPKAPLVCYHCILKEMKEHPERFDTPPGTISGVVTEEGIAEIKQTVRNQ